MIKRKEGLIIFTLGSKCQSKYMIFLQLSFQYHDNVGSVSCDNDHCEELDL